MVRRVIGGVGRALVTVGILILLFVTYQLWGTGLYTAREQSALKSEFRRELATARLTTTTTTTATTDGLPAPPPPSGDAIAIIRIPKIGLDSAVVQGVTVPDLRRGPGHYPNSPLPGQLGNAAIAGHRTTYGAEFNRLDELEPGDPILISTLAGNFRYTVTQELIVDPHDLSVLDPTPNATLTLTTCNPKYSAAQRLIIKATLDVERSPKPTKAPPLPAASRSLDDGLSGASQPRLPTLWWGLAVLAVGVAWWLLFHRYHRWTTWVMGGIPFAVVLFFFYFNLERLLPSNY